MFELIPHKIEKNVELFHIENEKIAILIENVIWIFDLKGGLIPNIELKNLHPTEIRIINGIIFIFTRENIYYKQLNSSRLHLLPFKISNIFYKKDFYFSYKNHLFKSKIFTNNTGYKIKNGGINMISIGNDSTFSSYTDLLFVINDDIIDFCIISNNFYILTKRKIFLVDVKLNDEIREINYLSGFEYLRMKYNENFICCETNENLIIESPFLETYYISKSENIYDYIIQKSTLVILSTDIKIYSLFSGLMVYKFNTTVFYGVYDVNYDTIWLYSNIFYELKINNEIFLNEILQRNLFKLGSEINKNVASFYYSIYLLNSMFVNKSINNKKSSIFDKNNNLIDRSKMKVSVKLSENFLSSDQKILKVKSKTEIRKFKKFLYFLSKSKCEIQIDSENILNQLSVVYRDIYDKFFVSNLPNDSEILVKSQKVDKYEKNNIFKTSKWNSIKNEKIESQLKRWIFEFKIENHLFYFKITEFISFLSKIMYNKIKNYNLLIEILYNLGEYKKIKKLVKFSKNKFKIELFEDFIKHHYDNSQRNNIIYSKNLNIKAILNEEYLKKSSFKNIYSLDENNPKIKRILIKYYKYHHLNLYLENLNERQKINYFINHHMKIQNIKEILLKNSNLLENTSAELTQLYLNYLPEDALILIAKYKNPENINFYFRFSPNPFMNLQLIYKALITVDSDSCRIICKCMDDVANELLTLYLGGDFETEYLSSFESEIEENDRRHILETFQKLYFSFLNTTKLIFLNRNISFEDFLAPKIKFHHSNLVINDSNKLI